MDQRTHAQVTALLRVAESATDAGRAQAAFRRAQRLLNDCDQGTGGNPYYSGGASREPFDVGHSVIQTDQIHPPNASDFVVPLMAPSRYLVLPNPPAVAPATTSPGVRLEFSAGGGWLIGWRGSAADNTPGVEAAGPYEQASMAIRMFINDGEELITNGFGADFVTMADVFPDSAQWAPIMRRMDVKDVLNVIFQNFQPAATGNTLQPRLTFAFWRERYPGTG